MRPVNLLPDSDRPRRTAAKEGTANIALGALGALLLVVVVVVLTQNQINDRRTQLAQANQEAQTASQQADSLASYGTFAQTKQTRQQSISQLANARFDWERFMRELALVLPSGTSIQTASGAASGGVQSSSSSGPATGEDANKPSVNLTGCAKSQPDVATLMVRLRSMYRAEDVELNDSSRGGSGGGSSSGSSGGSDSGGRGGTGNACAASSYTFDATVTFATDTSGTAKQRKVPSTLGGGA